jgi:alpha-galactosidase
MIQSGQGGVPVTVRSPVGEPPVIGVLTPAPSGRIVTAPPGDPAGGQPMIEVLAGGHGRHRSGRRLVGTTIGERIGLVDVKEDVDERGWAAVRIVAQDLDAGLGVECTLSSAPGVDVVRAQVRITNAGTRPITLQSVTSLAVRVCLSGDPVTPTPPEELELLHGRSEWLAEGRWSRRPLRAAGLPDLALPVHGQGGRGAVVARSQGSWSTDGDLPVGGLIGASGAAWLWQIESSGGWRWEIGEDAAGVYLALSGPTDEDHQWQQCLGLGESFTTVPVALALGADLDAAVGALTAHRRALRRPHPDNSALPVIFNDYMNTVMGDPSSARLLPLIDAAAAAGAQVFCIDAGWYADDGGWWDAVGEWLPSTRRFPNGICEVLDRIRERGMVAGLWLEPEVIGVRSPMAERLPRAAFWHRAGARVVEAGRYHLDLRHPAARAHLDAVVDRLVGQLGVGYFKLDYNIRPGAGTDLQAPDGTAPDGTAPDGTAPGSAGAGLLGHAQAYLDWLDGVLDRHPALVLENCASGAMRMDPALLSRLQLQSTSDQQDPSRYPAIAVAAPLSMPPEQCANWAYPQPGMPAEEAAGTLVTGLAGRLYLSGHLDRMSPAEQAMVREAVEVHTGLRGLLRTARPLWPLGLPDWDDPWLALALADPEDSECVLHLWHRRLPPDGPHDIVVPLPRLRGRRLEIDVLFPTRSPIWRTRWDPATATLRVSAPATPAALSARTLRLMTVPH